MGDLITDQRCPYCSPRDGSKTTEFVAVYGLFHTESETTCSQCGAVIRFIPARIFEQWLT